MKERWPFITGFILLTLGILAKVLTEIRIVPIVLILSGVSLKIYFIFQKAKKTKYHPGIEISFLLAGLALFFFGMYFLPEDTFVSPDLFIGAGIGLKIIFIIMFIKKTGKK
ncbi:hypothetical protein [Maribellus maritimus]|uniref:hypothetical protein n=1 Tax=Maribellus maritimus TaxID=2870838 RepID=UPI001EEC1D79|nr:hypothetical protein [Maribellus maritimus]MCG6187560.1 hypothetical protein [Maribellus maritimus]